MKTSVAELQWQCQYISFSLIWETQNCTFLLVWAFQHHARCTLYFHVLYIWYTQRCGAHCCVFTTACCIRNIFYSERVSSDRRMVDIGSLDVSLDDLLAAKSQKWWRLIKICWGASHNYNTGSNQRLCTCCHSSSHSDAGCTLIWCLP